ncbi:hypothetical protein EDD22DRAFT_982220 [Suillus occidentalis]|nr:hypothetical protein EDD22DRAFT_982220 [Suillus occidentalis]
MSIDDANYDDPTDYIYNTNSDDYVVTADQPDQPASHPTDVKHENPGHRLLPDKMSYNLHSAWKALVPTLVDAFLKYSARTHGHPLPEARPVISACAKRGYVQRQILIICLFFDLLVHHSLFPTMPSQPHMAISINLLAFYQALFEHSCDAIHALASALKTHYAHRGFQMTCGDGQIIQEPFRHNLGQAVQWFVILQVEVEHQTEVARPQLPDDSGISTPTSSNATLTKGRCSSILMQRCPACFAGVVFGRPLSEGGDIHAQVDEVRHRIQSLCKCAPKKHTSAVPDEAIDQCEHSYEAADGKKQKAAMDLFDDTGVMALICWHDIPLFFANIDSPGEQQKYAEANVIALYDVGCYDILPSLVTSRLRFATTAMHAYSHEWACQLKYNPQMCIGLGLSDGEGTERLWSRFVKLIGIQHSSSRQRRLWLIDRQVAAIGLEMQVDLGDWIKCQLKHGVDNQGSAVKEALRKCGITTEDLQVQWADQKKSQLSIRTHMSELDVVLALQADLDASDRALQATCSVVKKGSVSEETLDAIASLERSHECLMTKVEVLFPELQDVDLDFIRTLLMAHDLKINIWKRAIGSFLSGTNLIAPSVVQIRPLLHQQTHKAIAKCQPALMTAIRKFNSYLGDVPHWMEDPDRCQEEQRHLGLETDNLCQWFGDELAALELTLCLPTSKSFHTSMISANLTRLNIHVHDSATTRWVTPWASSTCLNGSGNAALQLATSLAGSHGSPTTAAYSLIPTSLTLLDPSPEEDIIEESVPHTFEEGPEQVVLSDVLQDGTISDEDDEDDDEDKSMGEPEYIITWQLPENLQNDHFKIPSPKENPIKHTKDISQTCMRPAQDGFPHQVFKPRDLSILTQPTARLNDTCVNGIAALLYSEVLTTSHRNTSWTSYWEKDIWLIPIHRPSPVGHWVFCMVYMSTKELHLFNSLTDRQPWQNDVKGRVARPLIVQPLQTNGYDCGAHRPGIRKDDMITFRHYIHGLVAKIPVS